MIGGGGRCWFARAVPMCGHGCLQGRGWGGPPSNPIRRRCSWPYNLPMTAPALTTTGTLHAAERCAALLHTTLPSRLHQKRVETMDIPTYLTHVAAAYNKMDVHAPSPLDILASAAAVINDCASGPSTPSSLDATAIVLVAPPALESTLQLSSPHAKFDASAIAADAENEPISILESHIGPSDHILCTTNTNPDEETYFVSGRPVRAAAEKAAKALSAGKENGISVWKKPTPRKTTRPRRRGAQSVSALRRGRQVLAAHSASQGRRRGHTQNETTRESTLCLQIL